MSKSRAYGDITVDAKRIITEDSPAAVKEAYRALYTNIMYLPIESKCKKLVITSAVAGEGKSSIAINLAYTIATTSPGARILLIDADMRTPSVASLMNIGTEGVHGLSEFLAGMDEVPSVVPSIYQNLDVLTSGAAHTNTTALLSSSAMQHLAEFCDEGYDYVIIDTPAVNSVTDAVFFSGYTDGYLLAVKADRSDVNSISEAIRVLSGVEANIIGFVLCSVDPKRSGKQG